MEVLYRIKAIATCLGRLPVVTHAKRALFARLETDASTLVDIACHHKASLLGLFDKILSDAYKLFRG
jgi:hypothetical protein